MLSNKQEYIRQEDAVLQLDNSVCWYGEEPCFVRVNTNFPTNTIHLQLLKDGELTKAFQTHINDPLFSTKPMLLGYMNKGLTADYISRPPWRKSKQGLSPHSLFTNSMSVGGASLWDISFYNLIKGIYPTLSTAYEMFETTNQESVAVSRLFSLKKTSKFKYELEYKNLSIGAIDADTKELHLLAGPSISKLVTPVLLKIGFKIQC